jgi:bifunctional UDP-N-acetylglucosamine pyrophosphorylase/glucosamine-1-phosphate N-acetyltransferase
VVVGHQAGAVQTAFSQYRQFVIQEPQLGTGHAVQVAATVLDGSQNTVIVLCGDVPLLQAATIRELYQHHQASGATATVLTVELPEPGGYGRIVKDAQGHVLKIGNSGCKPRGVNSKVIQNLLLQFPFLKRPGYSATR